MAGFASKLPLSMPIFSNTKYKYSLFSASVSFQSACPLRQRLITNDLFDLCSVLIFECLQAICQSSIVQGVSKNMDWSHVILCHRWYCARLRKVQSLLKADSLDGILCIHGIDSRYNSGTKQLLNYLLFGYCDLSANSISVRLTDEALEDLVVFIKHESVHVYCNPFNYPLILPFVGHWRNLHFHCLTKEEDDEEKSEEFKILSFISMVRGCPKIGIPYGHDYVQKSFDVFVIEKWPLIQAFALEGFGGGGFFTMVHEIVDVTSTLNSVYGSVDPVAAEILITQRLPLFERHCRSVLTNVDVESGVINGRSKLTEMLVSEPVVSYYKHGHMSDTSINISSIEDQLGPFVLFGVNTTKKVLDELQTRHKNGCLGSCGISGAPAKHMVCYATDPKGIISCVRTYFFASGFLPYSEYSTSNLKIQGQSKDLRLLIDLYLITVNAVVVGIHSFIQTGDITKAKGVVDSTIKDGMNKKKISSGPKELKFSLEVQDFLGRNVEPQNSNPSINKACLYLYDIPSIENPGKTLGSVAFGETFLNSSLNTINTEDTVECHCRHVVLTENVSRFVSWMGEDAESESSKYLEDFVKTKAEMPSFGKQLVYGDQCYVGGGTIYSKYEQGTMYVYEKGFIFLHPRYGAVSLPLAVISRMQFYDGESSGTVALMILKYNSSLTAHLPLHLINENNTLVIALMPRTKIFRQFYSDVLPLWKNTSDKTTPVLDMITDLPDNLHIMYLGLEEHKMVSHPDMGRTLQHAMMSFPELKSYLAHLHVSSSGDTPIHADDIAVVLGEIGEDKIAEENNNLEILLTILTGVPGSGKGQLCDTLVNLAKENSKWIILRSPVSHTKSFDPQALQTSLSNTLTSQRKLLVRMSGRKRMRVVLVTPGFTDIVDIVQAIYNHPNAEVKKNLKIGAVTCCIDPDNMFMDERYTLPKLLDQCAQGWVDNIVLTSCLDPQNEKLAMVQKLIRVCNPDAAFILAKGGEVTRSSDVDLILSDSAFLQKSAVQKRHLMCPGWSLGVFNSGSPEPLVNEICISLFGPLDKHQFVSKLRALQGPIHLKECLTKGAIHSIRGHILFAGHNTVTEVHWTALKGSLAMNTVDMTTMPRPPPKGAQNGDVVVYFIVFTGFFLQEEALKEWLRTCVKQKPPKKQLKTMKGLTQKELDQIKANHKCDPLPEGWFYTGTTYVCLTGEKTFQHPLIDKFIQQYLTSTNEDIMRHNANVDAMPQVDIFKTS